MKKILLMISMCLIVLGTAACGKADPTTVDYNGHTYDELKAVCEDNVASLRDMPDEQRDMYVAIAGMSDVERENYIVSLMPTATERQITQITQQANMISRWAEATKDLGEYKGLGEFTITKSGKTLTCEQEVMFEDRPVVLTFVYTYRTMEVEDITVDVVQTLGEKMTNAALNTVMGMGVVFCVLILISLVIYCFKFLSYFEKKFRKEAPAPASPAPAQPSAPAAPAPVPEQDDLELAAVIAAAVAASTGTPADGFVVRSIKRRA